MAEATAREELENRGYRLDIERRTCRSACGKEDRHLKRKFLREKFHNQEPWCECLFGRRECPYGERLYELIRYGQRIGAEVKASAFWDLYAEKGGKEFLIEVKFNSGRLTRPQRYVLAYVERLGFNALILRMRGKLDISI